MANPTNPNDWRDTRSPDAAADETREPEQAARIRAADDEATRARQDETEAGLREADHALAEGERRLRETGAALEGREAELARTAELTREVAERAVELRRQADEIADQI